MLAQGQSMMDWQPSCAICRLSLYARIPGRMPSRSRSAHQSPSTSTRQIRDRTADKVGPSLSKPLKAHINSKQRLGNRQRQNVKSGATSKNSALQDSSIIHNTFSDSPATASISGIAVTPPSIHHSYRPSRSQIAQAQQVLAQGVDEDWRRELFGIPECAGLLFQAGRGGFSR